MRNKGEVSQYKIVNYEEVEIICILTDKNGMWISERDKVIHLIHNRKDIKVKDIISVEDHFGDLYQYEVLEVGDCELVVFEL
jgi:hypothetical protein